MGKFPGKSYRTVNRKRNYVCLSQRLALPEDESMQAAKNICIGFAIFKDVFGIDDQVMFRLTAFKALPMPIYAMHIKILAHKGFLF
jgi:hypothetical protein